MKIILKRILFWLALGLLTAWVFVTFYVQRPLSGNLEVLFGSGEKSVLIYYHENRLDPFILDITDAFARGMNEKGWAVHRFRSNPLNVIGLGKYQLVVFAANAINFSPDTPTLTMIDVAEGLANQNAVGLVGGFGFTERAEKELSERLSAAKAKVLGVYGFWERRPKTQEEPRDSAIRESYELGQKIGSSF